MGLLDIHVDQIEFETVPKFVLFGGSDRDETRDTSASVTTTPAGSLPVSLTKVVAVSLVATVIAFGVAWLKGFIDSQLNLNC
ncbi:hypothetical protein [Halodesulfurarchaeum sp.]|uniref:hypothetical protein n=1 Tax=Halodesulfurarchaeum sp. TaxID=1980530 RepID=UPI002FC396A9